MDWRNVPGFPGYAASDLGQVRGLRGRPLRPRLIEGYEYVSVAGKMRKVHRLVAAAFLGESSLEVDHRDGDRANNVPSNLRYVTHAENVRASAAAGRLMHGERHVSAKMTEVEAQELLDAAWRSPLGTRIVAEIYGVSHLMVARLVRGQTWKHLPRPSVPQTLKRQKPRKEAA